jgi:hypothetical protein
MGGVFSYFAGLVIVFCLINFLNIFMLMKFFYLHV